MTFEGWGLFLAGLFAVFTLLSLVPLPHGFFRSFDFPRIQISVVSALLAAIYFIIPERTGGLATALSAVFALFAIFHASYIVRYTPLWPRAVASASSVPDDGVPLRLLTFNVKQANENFEEARNLLTQHNPDIAAFMETDERWCNQLRQAAGDYRHVLEQPFDNSYGLFIVSRFQLTNPTFQFLLKPEIPSLDTNVIVDDDTTFRLVIIHPDPPIPVMHSLGRDAEIGVVAKRVKSETLPVIVTGDLNDVAWSRTTSRFLRVSRLLDPRQGRGLYNSFDARFFFLRWPLDHLFLSRHFLIRQIRRLPHIGSDHFPMLYEVLLTGSKRPNPSQVQAHRADIEEVEEEIIEAKTRDDAPVGEDWER